MVQATRDVQQISAEFRGQVLARERRARLTMARSWQTVRDDLAGEIDGLLAAIERDGVRSANQLYRLERFVTFHDYATTRLTTYANAAHEDTVDLVRWAASFGDDAAAAMLAGTAAAVGWEMTAPSNAAVTQLTGRVVVGRAATRFKTIPAEAVKATEDTLVAGIGKGASPIKTAAAMRKAMDVTVYNSQRIARTETMEAYRGSQLARYQANRGLVEAWRWEASLDDRCCGICWAMDGSEFPVSTPFDTHVNCRCSAVPVLVPWSELGFSSPEAEAMSVRESGAARFATLSPEEQARILGPGRAAAYSSGVPLSDMVQTTYDPYWGGGRKLVPLKAL